MDAATPSDHCVVLHWFGAPAQVAPPQSPVMKMSRLVEFVECFDKTVVKQASITISMVLI